MTDVKNIDELRKHMLNILKKVSQGNIEVSEAAVAAKICDTIVSATRLELEYHKILEQKPSVDFLQHAPIRTYTSIPVLMSEYKNENKLLERKLGEHSNIIRRRELTEEERQLCED